MSKGLRFEKSTKVTIMGVPSDLEYELFKLARAFDLYTSHNETSLHVDDSRNVDENDGLDCSYKGLACMKVIKSVSDPSEL